MLRQRQRRLELILLDEPCSDVIRMKASGIPFAISDLPAGPAGPSVPFLGGQGFMISAYSENQLLAQVFLSEFMATPDAMLALYTVDPRPPAFLPALELIDDPYMADFQRAGDNGQALPAIPEVASVWGAWGNAMTFVVNGELTPEEAYTQAQNQIVELLADRRYLPEGGTTYRWFVFQNEVGSYALWLIDGEGNSFFARPDTPFEAVTANSSGSEPFSAEGVPASYEGYTLLERGARFRALSDIQNMTFGAAESAVGVRSAEIAGTFAQQWTYDAQTDTLTDNATGTTYTANNTTGGFVASNGSTAPIGFWVGVGFDNFSRIINTTLSQGPLLRVVLWTISFAVIGSLSGFAIGLVAALLLNGNSIWLRIARALMIIPYAVPGLVSVLVWRGMLNANIGVIPEVLNAVLGWSPTFSTDPGWAKVAILVVNLWFSAPYFMLIGSGALQAIPADVYEAAQVDGANRWRQFWQITLPLVLVSLGPLIIASIIFNFNNFFLMEGLFQGGPPMAGTSAPPVGHTDNLITYTYRLAFSAGGTKDYGLASAMGVIIFFIVGALTMVQFRLMRTWEQVSENV